MDEFIKGFLRLWREAGRSANTISAYQSDLCQLRTFLIEIEELRDIPRPNWGRIKQDVLEDFLRRFPEPATAARKLASLRTFFEFLRIEGWIGSNPTDGMVINVPRKLPRILRYSEIEELLVLPSATAEGQRDRAILELLYATGIRATELVSLNLDDLCLKDGARIHCQGRGCKDRWLPILEQRVVEAVATYVEAGRVNLLRRRPEEPALFVNRRGERLTRQGVWLILKGYAAQAELPGVSTSTLRHTFAVHRLQDGTPIRFLQDLLGHASLSTTQVYQMLTTNDSSTQLVAI